MISAWWLVVAYILGGLAEMLRRDVWAWLCKKRMEASD